MKARNEKVEKTSLKNKKEGFSLTVKVETNENQIKKTVKAPPL
jgi:hypothetical protein